MLLGVSRTLTDGKNIAIISIGQIGVEVQKAIIQNNVKKEVTHIDARNSKPLDTKRIVELFCSFDTLITVEESCLLGGFGQQIKALAQDYNYTGTVTSLGLPDVFVEHGEVAELRAKYGLDAEGIGKVISQLLQLP